MHVVYFCKRASPLATKKTDASVRCYCFCLFRDHGTSASPARGPVRISTVTGATTRPAPFRRPEPRKREQRKHKAVTRLVGLCISIFILRLDERAPRCSSHKRRAALEWKVSFYVDGHGVVCVCVCSACSSATSPVCREDEKQKKNVNKRKLSLAFGVRCSGGAFSFFPPGVAIRSDLHRSSSDFVGLFLIHLRPL